MRQISLSQGQFAVVDDADFEWLNNWRWRASFKADAGIFYVTRWSTKDEYGDGNRSIVLMHRFILGAPEGVMVDHRDRNTLNNQRYNLRLCTNGQNQANCKARCGQSVFKGVSRNKNMWRSRIKVKGEVRCKTFKLEIEAAEYYDKVALEHYGEFALTNKMLGLL